MNAASSTERPASARYGVSLIAVAAAIALRLALNPFWGEHKPFLLFFPAVMLAAWFGGFGPGALASIVAAIAVVSLWTERPPGAALPSPADLVGLAIFVTSGVMISALNESLHRARATERVALAEEARLRRISEEMMAIVAHDLRAPLNSIALNAALVGEHQAFRDDGGIARRLAAVTRAVKRMDGLIGDLLDAARLEEGQFSVASREEPIEGIVSEALEACGTAAAEKGIALHQHVPSVSVPCDRHRIQQVLANLLANAVRFTPQGGRVVVSAERDADSIVVHVEDRGPGISSEHLSRVFDRFWRGDRAGTGLGLHIARGIVEAHGGTIWVDSVMGQGTTFTFRLPGPVKSVEPTPNLPGPRALRAAMVESQK